MAYLLGVKATYNNLIQAFALLSLPSLPENWDWAFLLIAVGSVQIKGEDPVVTETREGKEAGDPPLTPSPAEISVRVQDHQQHGPAWTGSKDCQCCSGPSRPMCSWAQTSPVCQSISFQNETCGAPGKVGWCPVPSGFILLCYTHAAWFHVSFLSTNGKLGYTNIWEVGFWCVSVSLMGILSFPFLFIWVKVQKFGLRLTQVLEFFLLICFFPFPTIAPKKLFFIFHWFLPVLIPENLPEGTRAGYVLSAKDVLIVRESLAQGKLRKKKYLHVLSAFTNLIQCFHYHL